MRRVLITLIILLAIIAGVWFFYIKPRQNTGAPLPNILQSFFPKSTTSTGSFGTDSTTLITSSNTTATGTSTSKVGTFTQLTGRPVAGYTVFALPEVPVVVTQSATIVAPTLKELSQKAAKTTAKKISITPAVPVVLDHYLRYVSRLNGYVYEIKNGAIPIQISNIFVPNTYEAFFADNNNTAILRFLRTDDTTIATYSVPVPPLNPDGTRTQNSGSYFPDNITAIAVSPDQSQIARITNDNTGAVVMLSNSRGGTIKTILHSPFEGWLPSWAGTTVYMQTKAAAVADGFFYSVDQSTARLRRILGNVPGMTDSVSPSGTYVLYSQSTDGGFVTKILNTKTNVSVPISLDILPEKCAWLSTDDLICAGNNSVANGTYPDEWYAGTTHFSDQLYHIYTASNTYTVLYDGQKQSFDMTNVQVDEGQQIVYFIDKTTGLLWQFNY